MPRSLIPHAVHPSYRISSPRDKSKNKTICVSVITICVMALFCYLLFSSNSSSPSPSQVHPLYFYRQYAMNNNAQNSDVDTLELILRPKRPNDIIENDVDNAPNVQSNIDNEYDNNDESDDNIDNENNNDIKTLFTDNLDGATNNELLKRMQQRAQQQTKFSKNHQHKNKLNDKINIPEKPTIKQTINTDISKTDYWDFPRSSQIKPTETSSVQHIGEYEIHLARKKWFKEKYIDTGKALGGPSNLITDFNTRCPVYKTNIKSQWTPPLNEICNWTNTAIFWHSMHGTMIGRDFRVAESGKHWMWNYADELKESGTCSCPQNVAFVFADNQEKDMRLSERSYQYCNKNCNYFRVSKDYHPWDWFGKIGPLLDLINTKEFQSKYEYVVLTDADDQTLIKSPINIVEKFNFYNAAIVVAGEATSYPPWQGSEKAFENAVYPWSRHHQHLNAGGFMGKIIDMIPYLEYMKEDYVNFTRDRADEIKEKGRNFWRDQTCWRQMHMKFYPDIKIDCLAKLWTRTDVFMYDL